MKRLYLGYQHPLWFHVDLISLPQRECRKGSGWIRVWTPGKSPGYRHDDCCCWSRCRNSAGWSSRPPLSDAGACSSVRTIHTSNSQDRCHEFEKKSDTLYIMYGVVFQVKKLLNLKNKNIFRKKQTKNLCVLPVFVGYSNKCQCISMSTYMHFFVINNVVSLTDILTPSGVDV